MILPRVMLAALLGAVALAPLPAGAHSLESLQSELYEKEKYFEPKGQPAPDFQLQDADGNPFELSDFRGKVVVLHFIYAGCPDVCPLHADRIAEVQDMVNLTPMRDQVQFITITTDPVRDVPEVLKGYGPAHGLDPSNWLFLTSGPDKPEATTRDLVEAFGHGFLVTEEGNQVHGVVTHIIDQNGTLAANFHGLGFEPTNLVLYLNGLVNVNVPHKEPGPASLWDRVQSWF
jgi:protein SCO1/2